MNTQPDALSREELLALTNGHPPHREDGWTREMLPAGWRPLLRDECLQNGDSVWIHSTIPECGDSKPYWKVWENGERPHHGNATFYRTRRPAPPKAEEGVPDGAEVPLFDKFACFTRADLVRVAGNCAEQITDLRSRLTLSEQENARLTRERDEARGQAKGYLAGQEREFARAESAEASLKQVRRLAAEDSTAEMQKRLAAEATVSRLEGELADYLKADLMEREELGRFLEEHGMREDEFLLGFITRLKQEITSHTWIGGK